MLQQTQLCSWTPTTAGGCKNYPTFGQNPAWQVSIPHEQDVMFRLEIQRQQAPINTQDPDQFNICTGVELFRVNSNYPLPPGKVSLNSLKNANLATNGGDWTWNLSGCVSEKKKMEAGTYIIVATTFEPGYLADFKLIWYSQTPCQMQKYN